MILPKGFWPNVVDGFGLGPLVRWLRCRVGGHGYVVVRVMNPGARKVWCNRCGTTWAMHDSTRSLVPWDAEIEAMYAEGGPLDPATDPRTQEVPR